LANNTINLLDPGNPKINYNDSNDSKLKDYFQLNFSASRNFKISYKTRLTTSFSMLNILDNKNVINRYYRINKQTNSIEHVDTYSQAATPNINLKLVF
jgi:hypothetical protein